MAPEPAPEKEASLIRHYRETRRRFNALSESAVCGSCFRELHPGVAWWSDHEEPIPLHSTIPAEVQAQVVRVQNWSWVGDSNLSRDPRSAGAKAPGHDVQEGRHSSSTYLAFQKLRRLGVAACL